MSGRYLLDTNVAIQILNQNIDLLAHRNSRLQAFLCLTVVGELLFGAEKSSSPAENRARVQGLIEICPVVPHLLETAECYATIKARLKKKGRPIPENDIWIAAAAIHHGLILSTRDHHFEAVEGLQTEAW